MTKCTSCRKDEAIDTWWDKTKEWLIYTLFPKVIMDIREEKYTQGFGDGYVMGCKHTSQNLEVSTELKEIYDTLKV